MEKKITDIKCNVFFLLLATAVLILVPFQITSRKVDDFLGPRFFIYICMGLVVVVNIASIVLNYFEIVRLRNAGRTLTKKERVGFAAWASTMLRREKNLIIVMALLFVNSFVMPYLGFNITCIVTVSAILALFRVKKWYYYAVCWASTVLVYALFKFVLYTPLP